MTVIVMRKNPYGTRTFENVISVTQKDGKIEIDNGEITKYNDKLFVVLIRDMKLEG